MLERDLTVIQRRIYNEAMPEGSNGPGPEVSRNIIIPPDDEVRAAQQRLRSEQQAAMQAEINDPNTPSHKRDRLSEKVKTFEDPVKDYKQQQIDSYRENAKRSGRSDTEISAEIAHLEATGSFDPSPKSADQTAEPEKRGGIQYSPDYDKEKDEKGEYELVASEDGGRALVDKDGKEVAKIPKTEGGAVPELPRNFTEARFIKYVDDSIRGYERRLATGGVDLEDIRDLASKIQLYETEAVYPAGHPQAGDPIEIPQELRDRLAEKVRDHLYLASADISATIGNIKEFQAAFGSLGKRGVERLLLSYDKDPSVEARGENLAVRSAVRHFEESNGAFFRGVGRSLVDIKADLVAEIAAKIRPPRIPMSAAEANKKADESINLALKLIKVTGQQGHYMGPVDAAGNLIEAALMDEVYGAGATDIDLKNEDYWQKLQMVKKAYIPSMVNPQAGGSRPGLYHEDAPELFKNMFYLQDYIAENGNIKFKQFLYMCETRIRSLPMMKGRSTLSAMADDIEAGIAAKVAARAAGTPEPDDLKGELDVTDIGHWTGAMAGTEEFTKVLIQDPAILIRGPFGGEGNAARMGGDAIKSSAEAVGKLAAAYNFLGSFYKKAHEKPAIDRAKINLLKEAMDYMSRDGYNLNKDLRTGIMADDDGFLGWNDETKINVLNIARGMAGLGGGDLERMMKALGISRDRAVAQKEVPATIKGIWGEVIKWAKFMNPTGK